MARFMDTALFKKKAKEKHGDVYDYSKSIFVRSNEKLIYDCMIHGEISQTPNAHLSGKGCKDCKHRSYKLTNEEIIEMFIEVHGDFYDYKLVDYINQSTKVKVICPIHGEFDVYPQNHRKGHECKKCANEYMSVLKSMTFEYFLITANKKHNNKYDYSKVNFIDADTDVCIICPTHGEFFQTPRKHLSTNGCKKCSNIYLRDTESFINRAKEIHGDRYDYSKSIYIDAITKICIICKEHGEFWQIPYSHISGWGCSSCTNISIGENKISVYLDSVGIQYTRQKKFNGCVNKRQLPFDFYLDDYNICIEFDGIQHFEEKHHRGGKDGFIILQNSDEIKNKFCLENEIILFRIKYNDNFDKKMVELMEIIKNAI